MERYMTKEAIRTWVVLFENLFHKQQKYACLEWLSGIHDLNISSKSPPSISDINKKLRGPIKLTLIEPHFYGDTWFEKLNKGLYPISNEMRLAEEWENARRPDAYHDLIGHVPSLTNTHVAKSMFDFARIWQSSSEGQKSVLIKIWFFMIEFGTFYKHYSKSLSVFGGGILSSSNQLRIMENVNSHIGQKYPYGIHYNDFSPIIFPDARVEKYSYNKLICSDMDKTGMPEVIFVFRNLDHLLSEFVSASHYVARDKVHVQHDPTLV